MGVKQTAGEVYNAVTSKLVRRAAVYTILLAFGSVVLYGLAVLAYLLFYHNYLPDQVRTVPVHLQYGYELNPYGMADISRLRLKELQHYDITVSLTLPRSPANLERGNFMMELFLMDQGGDAFPALIPPSSKDIMDSNLVLFASLRPAVVPYMDPLVSLVSRLLFLPYYIFSPVAEQNTLVVPMAEKLFFNKASRIPRSLYLKIKAGQTLQTYSVEVTFVARLSGLRWMMYHHWITSFVLFTTLFWMFEVLFMVLSFVALGMCIGGPKMEEGALVKNKGTSPSTPGQVATKQEGEKSEDSSAIHRALAGLPAHPPQASHAPEEGGYEEDREDDGTGQHGAEGKYGSTSPSSGMEGILRRRVSQRKLAG